MIQIVENDFDDLKLLKNDEIKKVMRVFENEIQNSFHKLMHDVQTFETNSNVEIRIQTSKDFQKFIIFYNNVLFFCSELIAMNYKNND